MIRFTIRHDRDGYRARLWSGSYLVWWSEASVRPEGARDAVRIAKASYSAPVDDATAQAA